MEIICAECGCRVDKGTRTSPCADDDCCCRDLPTRIPTAETEGPADRSDTRARGSSESDGRDAPAHPGVSRALDRTFKIGMFLKGADGVLELAGGMMLLFVSPAAIQHFVRTLTAHELIQDPHDFVATHLLHTSAHLTRSVTLFGAVYLLSHGAAKVVLVALVLRDKLWAYPWMMVLLVAFIVYQIYRIVDVRFSVGLVGLTIFDAFLVWLTWREYRVKHAARWATA